VVVSIVQYRCRLSTATLVVAQTLVFVVVVAAQRLKLALVVATPLTLP
jgi:hypothetical protein